MFPSPILAPGEPISPTDHIEDAPVVLDLPVYTTKKAIKRAYLTGEIGLPDALPALMLEHDLTQGAALAYLGL